MLCFAINFWLYDTSSRYAVVPPPPMEPTASDVTAVFFDRQQQNGDTLFAYQRK